MENTIQSPPVEKKLTKQRLDKFLSNHIPDISRERLKTLIQNEHVKNDKGDIITSPSYKIKEEEFFILEIPENKILDVEAEDVPLHVLFEDEHLIVVNKPAGMSVHPAGPIVTGTLVNALMHHCKNLSGIGGVERPGIVHRLDKGTSGVMVVAKDDKTHQALSQMFQDRIMQRNYLALCYGTPYLTSKRIETQLGRHPKDRKKMAVLDKGGKEAITTFEIIKTFDNEASLLKFKLYSGRTHQIRVHAQHINHNIMCDPVYGKSKKLQNNEAIQYIKTIDHQMLHATILGFTHPITQQELYFEEPMPEDMQKLYDILNNS
jgi:23S rRNA pseudouridine1911/1915/1917 synthase